MSDPRTRYHRSRPAQIALAVLGAGALLSAASPAASASLSRSAYRAQRLCSAPRPGSAGCLGIRLVSVSLSGADLAANATRQAAETSTGAKAAVSNKTPLAGGLTPQSLHAAYSLPTEAAAAQTIAVVDAYKDPTVEADLGVYDRQFGLPACTSANGCFRKINQEGRAGPLPTTQGGWATETSLDVQMAHAICQSCHVLLVEAKSESFADLGAAVDAAVSAGATEVSNSYGGAEESYYSSYNAPYEHPDVVIAASSGDCAYFNQACGGPEAADFPASSPDVVAVGGTSLTQSGETWSSSAWEDGGSGCSKAFTAPLWQSAVAGFSATSCGSGRSVADVAAVANPYTGVDVYDSTPQGSGDPTGWGIWGGTSVASPIVAAEFALAGGAHGVEYPAATLYANAGDAGALTDVASGSNGSCSGASSCRARAGYDGPTGVGSPTGLEAFANPDAPANVSPPTVSGTAEQGQTLSVVDGEWSNSPTSFVDQWEHCSAAGAGCSAIAGATGASYVVAASYVGSTIRVQQSASNGSGSGSAAVSAASATVVSNAPTITGFTPSTAITGSPVTITGTALNGATKVRFGARSATFASISPTQIEATVPDGTIAATISITTTARTATSRSRFTPTLSLASFTPAKASAGKLVTITGVGFDSSSTVSFDGTPAAGVTYLSSTKLRAIVPSGAGSGAITVSNSQAPVGTVAGASDFTPS